MYSFTQSMFIQSMLSESKRISMKRMNDVFTLLFFFISCSFNSRQIREREREREREEKKREILPHHHQIQHHTVITTSPSTPHTTCPIHKVVVMMVMIVMTPLGDEVTGVSVQMSSVTRRGSDEVLKVLQWGCDWCGDEVRVVVVIAKQVCRWVTGKTGVWENGRC